jgi:hypothetical protein
MANGAATQQSWPVTVLVPQQVYERTRSRHRSGLSAALRSVMGELVRLLKADVEQLPAVAGIARGEGLRRAAAYDPAAKARMTVNIPERMLRDIEALNIDKGVSLIARAALFVLYERDATVHALQPSRRTGS